MKIPGRNLIAISLFGITVPVVTTERVLITVDVGSIQWTCFDDDNTGSCCLSIQTASQEASVPVPSLTSCTAQLAKVPVLVGEPLQISTDNIARYSLTLESHATSGQTKKQFLWEKSIEETKLQMLDPATFPYLIRAELSHSLSIRSELSASGGMHRLLSHSLEMMDEFSSCYVFLTVPNGMFIDLDDAFEGSSGAIISVHSSEVCDIEQPAFVSGQHIVIFEARDFKNDLNFASKLHLRYPHPSPANEQFVDLPLPQVLCVNHRGYLVGATRQKDMELVWVAAGNDDDYDVVMWTTVMVCLVGVVWMMADISHVARWD